MPFMHHSLLNDYRFHLPVSPIEPSGSSSIGCNNRFYGVPHENKAFVDRPDIAERIFKSLSNTTSHGCRIVVLRGRGGTGKTQMMLRYCYANRDDYDLIFWLVVDTKSSAISAYRDLAINLGLDKKGAMEESENEIIDWVRSWL